MARFVVVTFDGGYHEFTAETVDPYGPDLLFRENDALLKSFSKTEVLCWDTDLTKPPLGGMGPTWSKLRPVPGYAEAKDPE